MNILAFWLSLCFGSFLLFQVCHDTGFLFSMRAMTALGWLSNAHRDMIILVRCVAFLNCFAKAQEEKRHENWLKIVSLTCMYHAIACLTVPKLSNLGEHSEVSQARSLHARWTKMLTRQWNKTKHKLSQNGKNLQCLLKFGLIEDNVTVFQWPWNSESG